LASPLVPSKEFFLRKAIGWILREVSKVRPDLAYGFLRAHRGVLSGVTLREGVRFLPTEARANLMAGWRQRRHAPRGGSRARGHPPTASPEWGPDASAQRRNGSARVRVRTDRRERRNLYPAPPARCSRTARAPRGGLGVG